MRRAGRLRRMSIVLVTLAAVAAVASAKPVAGDVRFKRMTKGEEDFPPATFSHWVHRVKFKCYVCHNKKLGFEMKAGQARISMALIDEGKYCGACHKGRPAFAVSFETCSRCHRK